MMKRALIILLTIITLNAETMASTKSKKEKKYKEISLVRESEKINVPADKLWEIVGPGFENAGVWSTAVDHSVGSGKADFSGATCSTRACDLNAKGFDKITETLIKYDDRTQELEYIVDEGMPGFVTYASNHWQVIDLGNGQSALKMNISMKTKKFMGTLMGGMMKKNIDNTMSSVFRDIKVYAETGQISKEKEDRMTQLARKN